MNALRTTFANLRSTGMTACIPFVTVGDPDRAVTRALLPALVAAGAHVIELGVPYSDPLADGPVIQRATARALAHGTTIGDVLELARDTRSDGVDVPLVLFSYVNPIMQYGMNALIADAARSGICGLIVPDLPYEEAHDMRTTARAHGIALIPLVAPTSRDRIASIVAHADGFVYCVSSLGVTGERASFAADGFSLIETVASLTDVPVCVGFGISTREHVVQFSQHCDGIIVGSALVRTIEQHAEALLDHSRRAHATRDVAQFLRTLFSDCSGGAR
jgi:tryptophan synthase alpha chain